MENLERCKLADAMATYLSETWAIGGSQRRSPPALFLPPVRRVPSFGLHGKRLGGGKVSRASRAMWKIKVEE